MDFKLKKNKKSSKSFELTKVCFFGDIALNRLNMFEMFKTMSLGKPPNGEKEEDEL